MTQAPARHLNRALEPGLSMTVPGQNQMPYQNKFFVKTPPAKMQKTQCNEPKTR
jgi:hypothetical protein